jgi:DNA polymerase-3 subunit epsilon
MRQVVLDTETTGLDVEQKHRVIEIGCVELFNRRLTGKVFQRYLNPERDIDEGAQQVHGLSRERLAKEPKFAEISAELLEFIRDAELVIHNAPFDVGFLNAELSRLPEGGVKIEGICRVLDTLALARQMHPGQRNSLDALCKRYSIDNSHRDYHGALLDARILADVYLAMTGGQANLGLSAESDATRGGHRLRPGAVARDAVGGGPGGDAVAATVVRIAVVQATAEELAEHELALVRLDKASGGKTVWRRP